MSHINFVDFKNTIPVEGIVRLANTRPIFDIFADVEVPQDPDYVRRKGYARQQFSDVAGDVDEMRLKIAGAVLAAACNPVIIFSDIDGTASRFTALAADSKMVKGYKAAMARLNDQKDGTSAFCVTGRSEEDVTAILTRDTEDILSTQGAVLYSKDKNNLPVPAICSHGTVFLKANGEREEIPLNPEESAFVKKAHDLGQAIKAQFPNVVVQYKHSGIDVKDESGHDIEEIRQRLKELCNSDDNPAAGEKSSFAVHNEGDIETSIRFELVDKARALNKFVLNARKDETPALLIYIGDSFGEGGTDRRAAEYVQSLGGLAIQILNDRPQNVAAKDSDFQPDIILSNPEAAAKFMAEIVRRKMAVPYAPAPEREPGQGTQTLGL